MLTHLFFLNLVLEGLVVALDRMSLSVKKLIERKLFPSPGYIKFLLYYSINLL